MSKKINISMPNKVRPNLKNLFRKYLYRKEKEGVQRNEEYIWDDDEYADIAEYWDKVFPGWDDCVDVYPPSDNHIIFMDSNKGKNKRHKHKNKGKKAKLFNISTPYSGDEENIDEYDFTTEDYESKYKEIWFYTDYHYKEDKLEFNSVKEFSDYCEDMGYWIDGDVIHDISFRYESHCCLNPKSKEIGLFEIMSECTYGEMFYMACDDSELGG